MKKTAKVLLFLSVVSMSFGSVAGGGGTSWQPSVKPGQCLNKVPAPGVTLQYINSSACNEVISKGYAKGVYASGVFIYKGGYITRSFGVMVYANNPVTVNYPTSIDGAKYSSIGQTNYQWIK